MAEWRFDQGRLHYFQYDEIKNIAKALCELDQVVKPKSPQPDVVRETLARHTGLPFPPGHYYVWRNFGRVFGVLLLAAEIQRRICVTDLCRQIASNEVDCDDYLLHFARRFYYKSPAFQGYDAQGTQIFPVLAIIKLLIARYQATGAGTISLDEVHRYLIANDVTGWEDLDFYQNLAAATNPPTQDLRQVRELMVFISQFSFLTWQNPHLHLAVQNTEDLNGILHALTPVLNPRHDNAGREILQLGRGFAGDAFEAIALGQQIDPLDLEFVEGRRVRATHLRVERNPRLKELYFATAQHPAVCRMCNVDTSVRYPWVEHVIELHHLLPLASPVRVESETTSLRDLVGLCPSCHRATHKYYSLWFRQNNVSDFRSYEEARAVYEEARSQIALPGH